MWQKQWDKRYYMGGTAPLCPLSALQSLRLLLPGQGCIFESLFGKLRSHRPQSVAKCYLKKIFFKSYFMGAEKGFEMLSTDNVLRNMF